MSATHGQIVDGRIPRPAPATKPAEEKAEPKPGFFKRVFGKKTVAPAPTPAPTPRPRPKRRPVPPPEAAAVAPAIEPAPAAEGTPAPEAKPATETKPAPESTPESTPVAETPKPEEKPAAEATQPLPVAAKPKGKPKAKTASPKAKPAKPDLTGMSEAEKYRATRKAALEDEKIKSLASKAESALGEEQAASASAEFNQALFQKIRQIEPSLDAYVDRLEAAMRKRLAAEKKAN